MSPSAKHVANAHRARELYLDNMDPDKVRADWLFAVREARRLVAAALRASKYLTDIEGALKQDCAHSLVFRQILAPPMSQDQFKLACPLWNKGLENNGRPMNDASARAASAVIERRLDRGLVTWADIEVPVTRRKIETILRVASTLIALQQVSTARRNRLALDQENAALAMLRAMGWIKLPSKLIDTRAAVPPRHFMHKTRFATNTTRPQEVDIACGLRSSYVLAMECKVTNDETNSVKRVNDILKKATAWKEHWGSFVKTAALLQGVIASKDIDRPEQAGVHVFWSHDLGEFRAWLSRQS